jgi:hypothetical protein
MKIISIASRIFWAAFILLLSGCGGNITNGSNPNVQVNEISNNTTSYDETIHINNCGGKADSEQTKERSFSTSIEGGIDVGVQQVVEGIISAKYNQSRNTSVNQKLVAPAGTNMEFILRWQEEVRAGNVIVNGNSGTYTVKIPIAVEQVSSQDLGCSGNVLNPPSANQAPVNTVPQSPSYAEKLCPYGISQSEIKLLNVGVADVPTVQSYINRFDAGRPNDGGAFVQGTRIPAGVVVATNFDEANPNKWLDYPVIALVHSGSWGLFQSTGEYTAPNAGACRVIIP